MSAVLYSAPKTTAKEDAMSDDDQQGSGRIKCYAPIFPPASQRRCIARRFLYSLLVLFLLIGTLFLIELFPKGQCLIKKLIFEAKHCTTGNEDPGIEL